MMRILQVNCVYKTGSTGNIVNDIHMSLQKKNIESYVCYGRGKVVNEENVYKTSSEFSAKFNGFRARITGLQYNGAFSSTRRLIAVIKKKNPDIVHLHCINGYFVNIYRLLDYLKKNKIKTVLTLHAEFMHTGSCGYAYECNKWLTGCGNCPRLWDATKSYKFDRTNSAWLKMKDAFSNFKGLEIISVSQWLEDRARQSPIMSEHHFKVIKNGIDTENIFYPRDFLYLKEKHQLSEEKILLHVTANFSLNENDIKGGKYIVELAKILLGTNIKIIVIGGRDLSIPLPENIINVGRVNNQNDLAAYYSLANLTILTSKQETFSMVCAESLACGTPVIGFEAGAPETIALPEYSEFTNYGDVGKLKLFVNKWIYKKDSDLVESITKKSRQLYSKENMVFDYLEIYNKLLSE